MDIRIACQLTLYSLLFLFAFTANADNHSRIHFNQLTIEHGLPQNTILAITQDDWGFMWFGTEAGLVRYDGYSLKNYTTNSNKNSLSGNFINVLEKDPSGNLWVGTDSDGLNLYDRDNDQITRIAFTLEENALNSITALEYKSSEQLWLGTSAGVLVKFNPTQGNYQLFSMPKFEDEFLIEINTIEAIDDNILWLGTNSGIVQFNINDKHFSRVRIPIEDNYLDEKQPTVNAILVDRGNIWLGTTRGLFYQPKNSTTIKKHALKALSSNLTSEFHIHDLVLNKAGLWIATQSQGLIKLDINTRKTSLFKSSPSNRHSINDNTIVSLYSDSNQNIWVGTRGGGINYGNTDSMLFNHLWVNEESRATYAILIDKHNNLWLSDRQNGIYLKEKSGKDEHFTLYPVTENPADFANQVFYLFEGKQDTIWVGTASGLFKFNSRTKVFSRSKIKQSILEYGVIRAIVEDTTGSLWVGSQNGLIKLIEDSQQLRQITKGKPSLSISNNTVTAIVVNAQNNLWIGTKGGGLNFYDQNANRFKQYTFDSNVKNSLSDNDVYSLFIDSKDLLWVGTPSGLNRYNPETDDFTLYNEKNGLPNNVIYRIEEDNRGALWLSTNKGLSRFDSSQASFINYDTSDGLQHNEFNFAASFRSREGLLYFGGINGFNVFDPMSVLPANIESEVQLTELLILNKVVDVQTPLNSNSAYRGSYTLDRPIYTKHELSLGHLENTVSFEFSSFDFKNSNNKKYAYQLEGLDTDWIETDNKNRRATYTNLPSGQYILKIKTTNNDGTWSKKTRTLKLNVSPAPWFSWWAYSVYGCMAIALIALPIVRQKRKINDQQNLNTFLDQKVSERTYKIKLLADIGREISSSINFELVNESIYKKLNELMDASIFGVGIYDHKHQLIKYNNVIEDGKIIEPYTRNTSNNKQFAVKCIESKSILLSNDTSSEQSNVVDTNRILEHTNRTKSALSVLYIPLLTADKVIGLISVQSYQKNAYNQHHIDMLSTIASYVVVAIENSLAYKKIEDKNNEIINAQSQVVKSEKMASLGTLTAGVAHEINNPAGFTHAAVHMMQSEIDKIKEYLVDLAGGKEADPKIVASFDEQFKKLISLTQTAKEGTERIKTIVNELRMFARLDGSKNTKLPVLGMLNSTVKLVKTQFNELDITITGNFNPPITCQPSKLNQVFMNLIVNACQAVTAKSFDDDDIGKVQISLTEANGQLNITIEDNGIGIDEITMSKIFEPFYTTKDVGEGTGLGLSISASIIEEHGGTIDFASILNEGSKFNIYLPVG